MSNASHRPFTCNGLSEGPRFLSYIVHVEDEETGEEHEVLVHVTDGLLEVEGTSPAALWVEADYHTQQRIAERACDDYWDARQVARHGSYADV